MREETMLIFNIGPFADRPCKRRIGVLREARRNSRPRSCRA